MRCMKRFETSCREPAIPISHQSQAHLVKTAALLFRVCPLVTGLWLPKALTSAPAAPFPLGQEGGRVKGALTHHVPLSTMAAAVKSTVFQLQYFVGPEKED